MAIQVRSAAESAAKFVKRAAAASEDYKSGVSNAGPRWQAGAAASEPAYEEGVQAAISEKRFRRGIEKAGPQKYQDNAVKLGPERFRQGVANAESAYNRGVQPFVTAMAGATLSPRGARTSGANLRRVQEQNDLMRKTRREALGLSA